MSEIHSSEQGAQIIEHNGNGEFVQARCGTRLQKSMISELRHLYLRRMGRDSQSLGHDGEILALHTLHMMDKEHSADFDD